MATPADLEDFAIGFSLNEMIVRAADEIQSIDIIEAVDGIEPSLWLLNGRAELLAARRRHMTGPTGCGLCCIESLAGALRPPVVARSGAQYTYRQILEAMDQMPRLRRHR
jgi:FdhD protein